MRINGTVAKDITRQIVTRVFETFAENKINICVSSLPGKSWEFEKSVLLNHYIKRIGSTILLCYEHDFDLFTVNYDIGKNVLKDFIYERKYIENGKIEIDLEIQKEHEDNFLHFGYFNLDIDTSWLDFDNQNLFAWYDFCGNPSVERLNKIDLTRKNSVQIFTFATGWRCEDNVESSIRQAAANSSGREAILEYFTKKIEGSGYKIVFDLEYVSSRTPMILIAISDDESVIGKSFFSKDVKVSKSSFQKALKIWKKTKNTKEKKPQQIKVDKAPIYAALKAGMSTEEIMVKLNFSKGTISSCKAWITMGK